MPLYEYACRSCGHQFETIQKASEPVLTDCPACGEGSLKKLLSAPVFRLKGSGWYETDFKTGDKKNVSDNGESDRTDSKADDGKTKAAGAGESDKTTDAPKTKDRTATDSKTSSNATGSATAD